MNRSNQTGFTLIEMLITISVMILFVGVAIANYISFNEKQTVSEAVKQLKTYIQVAQSKARSGTIVNCTSSSLTGYRLTTSSTNPVTVSVREICADGSNFEISNYTLTKNIQVTSLTINFRILNGGTCLNAACNLANQTVTVNSDSFTYEFIIDQGGSLTEGTWITP